MELNENVFDYLNKFDIDSIDEFDNSISRKPMRFKYYELLDLRIDGDETLYEDTEFSRTPSEADNYRSTVEDILGFNLDGNLVLYLATEWPAFYHDANKYSSMKDLIISFMQNEGLMSDDQLELSSINSINFEDDDDIDYYEESSPDALHPHMESSAQYLQSLQSSGFTPLAVQSWDTPKLMSLSKDPELTGSDDMMSMGNEIIYDDGDIDDDFSIKNSPEEINKILMDASQKELHPML